MSEAPQPQPASTDATSTGLNAYQKNRITFGILIGLSAILTLFFYVKIPPQNSLIAVPEIFDLLTLTLVLLMWQTMAPPQMASKIATVGSCLLWVAGIVASFTIKPNTNLIYFPDAMLLIGFVPLLFLWRFSWPWFVFGLFNFGIGVFLQMLAFIADSYFPSAQMIAMKHHLSDYHPAITWWLMGMLSTLYGMGRMMKNIYKATRKKTAS